MSTDAEKREAWAARIRKELVQAVREEVRACGLMRDYTPCLPPPADPDAEQIVNGALASQEIGASELGVLEPTDFFDNLQRYFFEQLSAASHAGILMTRELLAAKVADDGISPDGLLPEINGMFEMPFASPHDVKEAADRIVECSRQRRLIAAVQKVVASIQTGERTFEQGIAALEKLLAKAKGLR